VNAITGLMSPDYQKKNGTWNKSKISKDLKISINTVTKYIKEIKRGVITTVKENNITYVVLDDKEGVTEVKEEVSQSSYELLTLVKTQQKEIRRLTKKLEKCNKGKEDVLLNYIGELKAIKQIQAPVPEEEDVIEVKEEKSKKSKKKKNKKKKK
jgi:hypothetical protein